MKGLADLRGQACARIGYIRAIAKFLHFHVRTEIPKGLVGSVLSIAAAVFALLSTLLLASLLDVVKGTAAIGTRSEPLSVKQLFDLNTAGKHILAFTLGWWGPSATKSELVLKVGLLLLAVIVLAILTNVGGRWVWISIRTTVILTMQVRLFAHVLDLPMSFHVHRRLGDILSRLHSDVGAVADRVRGKGDGV